MPYQVTWHPDAEAELATIWLEAEDRMKVTRAAHRIELFLQTEPHQGRYRSEELYRTYEPPLVAYYEIVDAERHVLVNNVLTYPSPPPA